MNESVSP